jgi:purine-cytosine permease-like protein
MKNAAAPAATAIESHGIDTVPEGEKVYRPWHLFSVLYGSNLTYSVIIFGAFPILFGLSWWASVASVVVGCLVGAVFLAPMSLFAPETGTNNAVSSGAHFGVAGRFIGTFIALFSALGFVAITIWTSGDALVAGVSRLTGTSSNAYIQALGYAVISVVVVGVAVRGLHLMVYIQERLMMPLMSLVLLAGVFAFNAKFDSDYPGGKYLLGTFWPTWTSCTVLNASLVISYSVFIGDWARYIDPKRHPRSRILAVTFLGGVVGLGVPILWGAYVSVSFAADADHFIPALIANSPSWYVIGLVLLGLIAGIAQGTVGLYGTGLDTSSLIPKLSRQQATFAIASATVVFVYLGAFVWSAMAIVNAFLIILLILTAPWMVIMCIGYLYRRGYYAPDDLQVFTRGQVGGRYWFSNGVNWRAAAAWAVSAGLGLLFSQAPPVYVGPWAQAAGGLDVSFFVALGAGGAIYTLLLLVSPEPSYVFGPSGPLFGNAAERLRFRKIESQ